MKIKYIKLLIFLLILFLTTSILPQNVMADTFVYDGSREEDLNTAWEDMLTALPEEIRQEAEKYSLTNETEKVNEYFTITYWWNKLVSACKTAFREHLSELSTLLAMLMITAFIRQWTGSVTESIFQFCSDVSMAITIFTAISQLMMKMHRFLVQLCSVMTAMIPVMTVVQYGMGEVTTASVNRISLTIFITVLNQLQRWLFWPLGQALCCISILSIVCSQIPLGGFTGGVRKLFTTLFSLMILIYSFVYGMQTMLAKSADSLGLRTVKFAMGSFIPVVGGTVAEAFSAVKEGLAYVRIMAGAGGIWILGLMFLPIAVSVLCFDTMLSVTHTTAELLGCNQSAKLLGEIKSIMHLFSGIIWMAVIFFLFAIILFTKSAGQTT